MAAGNGFLTVSPDTRYGATQGNMPPGYAVAGMFQVPGTGEKNISEIGIYGGNITSNYNSKLHLAIFEDDSGGGHPSIIVANSDSGEISAGKTQAKLSASYSTKPKVNGGTNYWLAFIVGEYNFAPSRLEDGTGTAIYITGLTYPTWPANATAWHTHTDQTHAYSLYAVYETTSGLSIPIVQAHYRRRR